MVANRKPNISSPTNASGTLFTYFNSACLYLRSVLRNMCALRRCQVCRRVTKLSLLFTKYFSCFEISNVIPPALTTKIQIPDSPLCICDVIRDIRDAFSHPHLSICEAKQSTYNLSKGNKECVCRVSGNWLLIKSQGTLKFSKMDKFLKRTLEKCNNEQENVPSTSNVVKKQKNCQKTI